MLTKSEFDFGGSARQILLLFFEIVQSSIVKFFHDVSVTECHGHVVQSRGGIQGMHDGESIIEDVVACGAEGNVKSIERIIHGESDDAMKEVIKGQKSGREHVKPLLFRLFGVRFVTESEEFLSKMDENEEGENLKNG